MFKNKVLLITGGTGSFGNAVLKRFLDSDLKEIRIFSRDEKKQDDMRKLFDSPKLKFYIGDVRDYRSVLDATRGVDFIFHAAALKQVPSCEFYPMEAVKTNVLGTENLINACLESDVKSVIALSTDKAAAPINLYGATKLTSDKLFIAANNIRGRNDINFSVVRYGNVMGSNGSVIPLFLKKKSEGVLPITDSNMTRFNISLEEGVDMVLYALEKGKGGEIFVPKIPSYKITDLATAICDKCEQKIIGVRSGEKIHEEMITSSDSYNTYDLGKYFVILPQNPVFNIESFIRDKKAKKVKPGFSYNSGQNKHFLTVDELRILINNNLD